MCGFCLLFFSLLGNGTIGLYTRLVDLSVSDSSDLEGLELVRWMLECDCAEWDWMVLTLGYQLSFLTSMYG